MTERLFWKDMYMKEFDATVLNVNGDEVILDRTCFYPTGGGQPNDTGLLLKDDKKYQVIDVYKNNDDIIHKISGDVPGRGDKLHGIIDWDRRYSLMRYHTAVHIIDGVVKNYYNDHGMLTGGQLYTDHARVDFDFDDINRELIETIINQSNEIIEKGLNVFEKTLTRDEALAIPDLARTEPGRRLIESLDYVRVIEIEGFDMQSDGGTHVKNTSEVGKIIIKKIENKGRGHKRLEFTLQ
ncbi:alanyl-tRNA editing protein AlaXM [Picrophilus oshimae]|nr:alanyl-tRNA editing protein AlaXM [Picrophilus oshimae]